MTPMRVLVIDAIASEGIAYLRERGFEVDQVSSKLPKTELYGRLADYEAVITRSSTAVTADFLARARRLRILGRAGVGVDNIDIDACSRQGVVIVNAPYGNVVSAAEHTVGMLLALLRKIPLANDSLKRFEWDRGIYGVELHRKTAGVLGLGKVGSRVAARLRAFDMSVLVYDPYIPESRARDLGVKLADLASVLAHADIVTVHVPLNDETENMLAAREIALMKPGVRIVNCARGGIVHEGDLLAALESGHVAGAALDVWSEEPPVSDLVKRLIGHPCVVVTPHLGANTQEAQINVAVDVARQLVAFRDGELVEHAVNIPVGDREQIAEQRPFLALAELLGRFCVQLEQDNVERVDVLVAGRVARRDSELIGRAVLKGLLEPGDGPDHQPGQRPPRGARAGSRGGCSHRRRGRVRLHQPHHRHDPGGSGAQDHCGHRVRRRSPHRQTQGPELRIHPRGPHPRALLRGPARHGGPDRLHPGPPQRQHRLDARGAAHEAGRSDRRPPPRRGRAARCREGDQRSRGRRLRPRRQPGAMSKSKDGRRAGAGSPGERFETRPWGAFETLQEGPGFKVKRLLVKPGQRLSLQRHRFRAESWVVVSGSPRLIVAGRSRRVRARDVVSVPRGAWHRIENPGTVPVTIIEVQHGSYLGEDDIIRRHDDYGRVAAGGRGAARPSASEARAALLASRRPRGKRAQSRAGNQVR